MSVPTYPDYDVHRFLPDVANHEMTVLRDDGLYRHLHFRGTGFGTYWFDLVTWPGCLAINGDMGGYQFRRVPDMFEFFRGPRINPDYWAEKTPQGRDSVREYSPEQFEERVKEHVVQAIRDREAPRGIGRAVTRWLSEGGFAWEDGARKELESFGYGTAYDMLCTCLVRESGVADHLEWEKQHHFKVKGRRDEHIVSARRRPAFVFHDVYEWDFRDYTWQYLWACHAIRWGIEQYDNALRVLAEQSNCVSAEAAR
ncbi:hypothetical protein ACFVH6_22230 [Spirillospora sp. NPDC127200]